MKLFPLIFRRIFQRLSDFSNAGGQTMSRSINISEELYLRLAAHASGFDTPSDVIEKLLNSYESIPADSADISTNQDDLTANESVITYPNATDTLERSKDIHPATSLVIVYTSGSEENFKQELLDKKRAYIKLLYTNGETQYAEWNALNFRPTSSVDGNLRSGYLRSWRQRGITRAILSVNRDDLDSDESVTVCPNTTDSLERDRNTRPAISLLIVYVSGSEEKFKRELLAKKRAYIRLFYTNGETEDKVWNALNIRPTSSIDNNLRTGYLRSWRQRGITKVVLSVNQEDLDCSRQLYPLGASIMGGGV